MAIESSKPGADELAEEGDARLFLSDDGPQSIPTVTHAGIGKHRCPLREERGTSSCDLYKFGIFNYKFRIFNYKFLEFQDLC